MIFEIDGKELENKELDELNSRFRKEAFFSKIKGVTFNERQENISKLKCPQQLFYVFEDNEFDSNAIHLYADEAHSIDLGYISKELAGDLRLFKKHGIDFEVRVRDVTGGPTSTNKSLSFGCNILIMLQR